MTSTYKCEVGNNDASRSRFEIGHSELEMGVQFEACIVKFEVLLNNYKELTSCKTSMRGMS
jgi:hypothetical protein